MRLGYRIKNLITLVTDRKEKEKTLLPYHYVVNRIPQFLYSFSVSKSEKNARRL